MALWIVERTIVVRLVIPNEICARVGEIFHLARDEGPAYAIVLLIAGNATHDPSVEIYRLGARVLKPYDFRCRGLENSDDFNGIVGGEVAIRIDLTTVV